MPWSLSSRISVYGLKLSRSFPSRFFSWDRSDCTLVRLRLVPVCIKKFYLTEPCDRFLAFTCSIFCLVTIVGRPSGHRLVWRDVSFRCSGNDSHGFIMSLLCLNRLDIDSVVWSSLHSMTPSITLRHIGNIWSCSLPFADIAFSPKNRFLFLSVDDSTCSWAFFRNGSRGVWDCSCILWLSDRRKLLTEFVLLFCARPQSFCFAQIDYSSCFLTPWSLCPNCSWAVVTAKLVPQAVWQISSSRVSTQFKSLLFVYALLFV